MTTTDALGYLPCWAVIYPRAGGRFAGWASETEVAGTGFIAIDTGGRTELLYPKDCWRITQATEAEARSVAQLPPAAEQDPAERYADGTWGDEGRVYGTGDGGRAPEGGGW